MKQVVSRIYDTKFGAILISSDGEAITGLRTVAGERTAQSGTAAQNGNAAAQSKDKAGAYFTDEAARQLKEYFEGTRREFQIPIHPGGTDFQREVWNALLKIPYGETRSYKQIAQETGNLRACRAVGMANNRNPIWILIPCHRVIGSDGSMTGYGGGIEMKERLLELENHYAGKMKSVN